MKDKKQRKENSIKIIELNWSLNTKKKKKKKKI